MDVVAPCVILDVDSSDYADDGGTDVIDIYVAPSSIINILYDYAVFKIFSIFNIF